MARHHCLRWKNVKVRDIEGKLTEINVPTILQMDYRGTLLSGILGMQKKSPITFEFAVNLISDKQVEALREWKIGPQPGHDEWYSYHFLEYISDLGYHIELTGDEFEPLNMQNFVA